jgi:hypothetical protein
VASIVLIGITVLTSIAVAVWMGGMTVDIVESNIVTSKITPNIFSKSNNIAVLNETGIFNIQIQNNADSPKNVSIQVVSPEGKIDSKEIELEPKSVHYEIVNENLTISGLWNISVLSDSQVLDSYSFLTLTNRADALMQISAQNNLQGGNDIAAQSNMFAMLSLLFSGTISCAALIVSLRNFKWLSRISNKEATTQERSKDQKKDTQIRKHSLILIDLNKVEDDGSFSCPNCGTQISPKDETEQIYHIVKSKIVNEQLAELVISCNVCDTIMKIIGFENTFKTG